MSFFWVIHWNMSVNFGCALGMLIFLQEVQSSQGLDNLASQSHLGAVRAQRSTVQLSNVYPFKAKGPAI